MSADAAPTSSGQGARERRRRRSTGSAARPAGDLALADVERLYSDPSPSARASFAMRFGERYDSLLEGQTGPLANAILTLLVKDVEVEVRKALATAVAASPGLPPAVLSALARDEIDVARPVLEQNPVLDDAELEDIVRTRALQHALAVAGRERISEHLADVLAAAGDPEVVARLLGNTGAKLSDATLCRLAEDHAGDRRVQDRLIARPALPFELVDRLVDEVSARLEWELIRRRQMSPRQARHLLAQARERMSLGFATSARGDAEVERELRRRMGAGELGPDDILLSLREGEVRWVEIGIAVLAGVDQVRTRHLLYGFDRRGLGALCLRAGFPTPHYLVLRLALDLAEEAAKGRTGAGYPAQRLQYVQRQYETMRADKETIAAWFDD